MICAKYEKNISRTADATQREWRVTGDWPDRQTDVRRLTWANVLTLGCAWCYPNIPWSVPFGEETPSNIYRFGLNHSLINAEYQFRKYKPLCPVEHGWVRVKAAYIIQLLYLQTQIAWWRHQMETFSALPALCAGKFTGHRWIPLTKLSDAELWCFLWSAPEPTPKQTMGTRGDLSSRWLWRHCNGAIALESCNFSKWLNIFVSMWRCLYMCLWAHVHVYICISFFCMEEMILGLDTSVENELPLVVWYHTPDTTVSRFCAGKILENKRHYHICRVVLCWMNLLTVRHDMETISVFLGLC